MWYISTMEYYSVMRKNGIIVDPCIYRYMIPRRQQIRKNCSGCVEFRTPKLL
jgi:hypothetical protein